MKGLRSIRALAKESLRGVEPAKIGKGRPKFEWVDPKSIYVEEVYQRSIVQNGTKLIRKIYSSFAWNRFKPPICVRLPENGSALICIDGQHTATACASHPDIDKIPVMVVDAADVAKRAEAFVGHNRDRLALTTVMIYVAELAAGDPLAVMIDEACREAGASIPKRAISTAIKDKHPIGTTVSIGAIRAIAKRQGKDALRRVLKLLVAVGRGPIKSAEIAALALVLAEHPKLDDEKVRQIIARKTTEQWTAEGYKKSVASEKAIAICLAEIWCDLLRVRAPHLDVKGNNTDHARLFNKPKEPMIKEKSAAPLAAATAAPAAKASPIAETAMVERDGIRIDLERRRLVRKGQQIELSAHETGALSALVKVMPAILPNDRIAMKAFGDTSDAAYRVKALAQKLSPRLAAIGLKLREVPKMGFALGDAA